MSTPAQPRPRKRGLPSAPRLDVPRLHATDDEPPFLRSKPRARVKRVRRGLASRVALGVQLGALALALVGGGWIGVSRVLASERLHVSRVKVRGNHFLSEGEVRELLGLSGQESILGLDMETLKQRLRASPWLEEATLRRTLPDAIEIDVHERAPLALAELDRLYLMDASGDLIDLYGARTAAYDLPIVRGLKGLGAEARRERAERAAALLSDVGELQAELSEIQVEDSGDLQVVLHGGGELLKFGAPPYRKSLEAFLALRQKLTERCPRAEYFDLRFRDRIYAKEPPLPQPKAAAAAPGPEAAPTLNAPAPQQAELAH